MNLNPDLKKFLLLSCVAVLGFWMLFPFHNFQAQIAPGDNGRDLYCYEKTLHGALPYQDYWWVYGPLMPYYYSLLFILFGVTIKSILWGSLFLNLITGILIFLILQSTIAPFLALIAALWFWTFSPPFGYTYNHIGGITCMIGSLYCLFRYVQISKPSLIYKGLIFIFFLGLIKINVGLATLLAFILSVLISDKWQNAPRARQHFYTVLTGSLIIIFLLLAIYVFLLHKLPLYAIRQCLPYLPYDRPIHTPLLKTLFLLLNSYINNFFSSISDFAFGMIIFIAAGKLISNLRLLKGQRLAENKSLLWLIILLLYWCFTLHEYLLSGIAYRTYWIVPIQIIIMFLILGLGTQHLFSNPRLKYGLGLTLFFVVLFNSLSIRFFVQRFKVPQQYLDYPQAQIYVTNSQDWLKTVRNTVDYVNSNLKEDETLLALPYEPLYYYLTRKDSPTRQLIFFDHINIPPEQEQQIIASLQTRNVKLILLSNRSHSPVTGLGTFGKTYGVSLAQYIINNYDLVETLGDWDKPGGTFDNHAVRIYRKK